MADLKRTLKLLSKLEADGKLVAETAHVNEQYDPQGFITLTVRAVDVPTREQFLVDLATTDTPEPEPETPAPKAKPAAAKRAPRATKATKAKK